MLQLLMEMLNAHAVHVLFSLLHTLILNRWVHAIVAQHTIRSLYLNELIKVLLPRRSGYIIWPEHFFCLANDQLLFIWK